MTAAEFNLDYIERRILELVSCKVRNGEVTERNLARTSGISQPHLHQILKGTKRLSPRVADLLLARLDLSVLHLFDSTDLDRHVSLATGRSFAFVPVLEGRLGPGYPWPATTHRLERFPVPCRMLRPASMPRVVRLAGDPEVAASVEGNFALLGRVDGPPDPDLWYAFCIDGEGLIRRVQATNRSVLIGSAAEGKWKRIAAGIENWPQCVRARVEILGSASDLLLDDGPGAY